MIKQCLRASVAATLWGLCVSCGGTADGLSQVKGKVVCNGQPAAGAILLFQRQSGEPSPPASAVSIVPQAVVGDDGSFVVRSDPLGYGAAPGKYNVLVNWPEEPALGMPSKPAKTAIVKGKTVVSTKSDKGIGEAVDRLKGRYMNSSKPLLQAEVKPGSNDVGTFELELGN